MEIRKISLISLGDKGLEINYLKAEEKKGRTFTNEIKEKRKYPIHNDLDQLFKKLRFYMLHITGIVRDDMEETEREFIASDSEVTAVKIEGTVFSIIGTKRCDYGSQFKLETPKIDQHDEYPYYEEIWEIIKSLKEETRLYMNGTKAITAEEAIVRQIESGRRKDMKPENWDAFSADEKKEFCTSILQKEFGSMVMHMEDAIEKEDDDIQDVQEVDLTKVS